ncbi:ferredoxin family protein [Gordonia desulfuricans]|uniref:Ferredoxin family protein n=1 Tax=Gordonia desulfuricans TaxID=89051 RepID=A0A7K3LVR3_9ACTN|nr:MULTISPECIES: ferredoxin family protein [Gordonia]KOY49127.1 4Fe-4S ferredoxin [Gordonia sp. NB41Y]NDK91637.1 ferredoxin family protein [Gordonia desulfuricans]WLP89088.1 ferredoxin family protein [Gordonia sp. NB41Y]
MIELVIADACIGCDKCVAACPTNVFDSTESGVPVIARQSDCQTCFMCEAYCPTDALYVGPDSAPADPQTFTAPADLIGSYRAHLGWGSGRQPGSRTAVGPPIPHGDPPPRIDERIAAAATGTP